MRTTSPISTKLVHFCLAALACIASAAATAPAALVLGLCMPASASGQCAGDADGDSLCDGVDPCPDDGLDDADGDGKCVGPGFNAPKTGGNDNCPTDANGSQIDADADGRGDACDLCPNASGAAEDLCLTTGFWSGRAPNAQERHEGGMATVGGLNYLLGGEQTGLTTEVYNPLANTWSTVPSLPAKRHHIQPVVVKGKIYVIGGLITFPGPSVNTVYMFDPANPGLGWQTRAPLPTSRGALGCAADGIKIYCAGGLSSTAGDTAIAVMEVYNTVANTWSTLAPMPRERDHFQGVIIGGKFYAISGRDTAITPAYAFNDVYDIATNTWSQGAPIPTPRGGYAVAVMQGRIIIISGEGGGPNNGVFPNVQEYDPRRNAWRALANIPTARHGIGAGVSKVEDGVLERAYVASGGPRQGGSKSNVHEVFAYHTSNLVCFSPGNDPTGVFAGAMTTGTQFTAGADDDPLLDNLSTPLLFANSTTNSTSIGTDNATYKVNLALPGNWYLWGRFYYPGAGSNDANSFSVKIDSGGTLKFGNNKTLHRKWHFDGNGATENGAPDGLLIGALAGGTHTVVIAKREVVPIPPRLDLVCFSQSATPPTDEAACAAWGGCAPPGSTTTSTSTTTTLGATTTTLPPANALCVAAGGTNPAGAFSGNMDTSTQFTGGADNDPLLDNLTTPLVFADSTTNSTGNNGDNVSYSITVPATDTWFLWGRFYYPGAPGSNDANSFSARLDSGSLKKFGNNKSFFRKWHWGGDGAQETGTPVAISLGNVAAGAHTITVYKREVTPALPPRLDVFCLTRNGVTPPTDIQACALVGGCP